MRINVVSKIVCPYTNRNLDLVIFEETINNMNNYKDVITGLLFSKNSVYPIINSIPRMLPDSLSIFNELLNPYLHLLTDDLKERYTAYLLENKYLDYNYKHAQKSFSAEWEAMDRSDRAWGRNPETRLKEFIQRLDIELVDIDKKIILDAGCGHGEIEVALSEHNVDLFAIDISFSVDEVQKRLQKLNPVANVHVIQANVCSLPFRENLFDYVFSDGVLHHTPSTRVGFESISKVLKIGGKCFIMVYSYDYKNKLDIIIDKFIKYNKWFFNNIPHGLLHLICYILSPFYWIYLRIYNLIRRGSRKTDRSLKELGLSLFDAFSPKFDWNHSSEEVFSWYKEFGYNEMKQTFFDHSGIGIVGIKNK